MQIKCCFHNHSSVPLSEVRFARSPVRPVLCHQGKGNFHKGPLSLARPTSQPTDPIHPPTPPPIRQLPSLRFNNRKLSSRFSYMLLIKRTSPRLFSLCLPATLVATPSVFFLHRARATVFSPPPSASRSCFHRFSFFLFFLKLLLYIIVLLAPLPFFELFDFIFHLCRFHIYAEVP